MAKSLRIGGTVIVLHNKLVRFGVYIFNDRWDFVAGKHNADCSNGAWYCRLERIPT